jgi:hypothetical protein
LAEIKTLPSYLMHRKKFPNLLVWLTVRSCWNWWRRNSNRPESESHSSGPFPLT